MPSPRRLLFLALDGIQSLDLLGPVEVFERAERLVPGSYRVEVVGPVAGSGGHVTMSNGLTLGVEPLPDPPPPCDTLVVAGGEGPRAAAEDPPVVDWIVRASAQARRTASVCTGAHLLAAAGLLDGRNATTHWAFHDELTARHPTIRLDPEPLFVRDGHVWTSAGVTTGMDLALALVEDDLGAETAQAVARHLEVGPHADRERSGA
jgi:transcriptional regulator GlxA family with amidase domain